MTIHPNSLLPRDPSIFNLPFDTHLIKVGGFELQLPTVAGVTNALIAAAHDHNLLLEKGAWWSTLDAQNGVSLITHNMDFNDSLDWRQWDAVADFLREFAQVWQCVELDFGVIGIASKEEVASGILSLVAD